MFDRIWPKEKKQSSLDEAIEDLVSEMKGHDGDSDEYTAIAHNLRTLMEARGMEPKPRRVSPDTIAVIAANLTGIAMILVFERANVVTSKGLNFIMKPKL